MIFADALGGIAFELVAVTSGTILGVDLGARGGVAAARRQAAPVGGDREDVATMSDFLLESGPTSHAITFYFFREPGEHRSDTRPIGSRG